MTYIPRTIINGINSLSKFCYNESKVAGWHDDTQNDNITFPIKIALIHSELSEALEGHRKSLQDSHLPERTSVEVELADALIRIFDLAGKMGLDLGGAISEKLLYNKTRSDHKIENRQSQHGKKY